MDPNELLDQWRADFDVEDMEEMIAVLDRMRRGLIERVVELRTEAVKPVVRCRRSGRRRWDY